MEDPRARGDSRAVEVWRILENGGIPEQWRILEHMGIQRQGRILEHGGL